MSLGLGCTACTKINRQPPAVLMIVGHPCNINYLCAALFRPDKRKAVGCACMICRVSDCNGRAHLPVTFIEANNVSYGQPVLLKVSAHGKALQTELSSAAVAAATAVPLTTNCKCCTGSNHTYLCSASVSASSDVNFDPSVLCGQVPAAGALLGSGQQQGLVCSVSLVSTKVVTAVSLEVRQLSGCI
jgi:hypothetical protein